MEKLNNTKDVEKYLNSGEMTKPFLDADFVLSKVMYDYNARKEMGKECSKLQSLYLWIHHNVKFVKDDPKAKKFQRTAKEIWESKVSSGCTDYAMLFCVFARQIGIPTTLLHTAELNWIERLKNGERDGMHYGHSFCECYDDGKWILVDPSSMEIEYEYNPDYIELSYKVGEGNVFIPYLRGLDLGESQTVKEHNEIMEEKCLEL